MQEQEEQEYIERYLKGELEGTDKDAFEERLSNDDEFRAQVSDVKDIIMGIKGTVLRGEIAAIHEEERLKPGDLSDVENKDEKPVRPLYFL